MSTRPQSSHLADAAVHEEFDAGDEHRGTGDQPTEAAPAGATRYDKRRYVYPGTATAAALAIWLRTCFWKDFICRGVVRRPGTPGMTSRRQV
ncbi:hypothetical protein ACFQ51_45860 [Streptomyces kaempferi]